MKEISKRDQRIYATGYGKPALIMSLPFMAIGVYALLAYLGYAPIPKPSGDIPIWIFWAIGGVFGVAGLMFFVYSVKGLKNKRRAEEYKKHSFGEAWFVDYPWDREGIKDNASKRWVNSIGFVLFMILFLAPFHWVAFFSGEDPGLFKIIVIIFDIVVVIVFVMSLYQLLQYLKFGTSYLEYRDFPFFVGDKLNVALRNNKLTNVDVTLRYVMERFETTGSGNNRSTTIKSYELYGEKKRFDSIARGAGIEIEFDIPDDKEMVNSLIANPDVKYWELFIESDVVGIDFETTFLVPIYGRG